MRNPAPLHTVRFPDSATGSRLPRPGHLRGNGGTRTDICALHSQGLRRFGLQPNQLTDTPPGNYPQSRKWAAAAHTAGLDGALWMSHQLNGNQACVVFGDRVPEDDLSTTAQLALDSPAGFDWLVDTCAPMKVDVLPPF